MNANERVVQQGGSARTHPDPESGTYGTQTRDFPDLDANAPFLQSGDIQRLNRKALVFLRRYRAVADRLRGVDV